MHTILRALLARPIDSEFFHKYGLRAPNGQLSIAYSIPWSISLSIMVLLSYAIYRS